MDSEKPIVIFGVNENDIKSKVLEVKDDFKKINNIMNIFEEFGIQDNI